MTLYQLIGCIPIIYPNWFFSSISIDIRALSSITFLFILILCSALASTLKTLSIKTSFFFFNFFQKS